MPSPGQVGFWGWWQSSYFRGSLALSEVHVVAEPSGTCSRRQERQPIGLQGASRPGSGWRKPLLSSQERRLGSKVQLQPVGVGRVEGVDLLGEGGARLPLAPLSQKAYARSPDGRRRWGRVLGACVGLELGPPGVAVKAAPAASPGGGVGGSAGTKGLRGPERRPPPTPRPELRPWFTSPPGISGSAPEGREASPATRGPAGAGVTPFMEEVLAQPGVDVLTAERCGRRGLGCSSPTPLLLGGPHTPTKAGEPETRGDSGESGSRPPAATVAVFIAPDPGPGREPGRLVGWGCKAPHRAPGPAPSGAPSTWEGPVPSVLP